MLSYPDTVILDPVQGGFSSVPQTFAGGRLMNYCPHVDGLINLSSGSFFTDSALLLNTRTAAGNWVLSRTAAAAETYHVCASPQDAAILRTGETYNRGGFNAPSVHGVPAGPKGFQINDVFVEMNVGVVALTSATLGITQSVYPLPGAAAAAPVITNVLTATAIPTAVNAAGTFLPRLASVVTPSFSISDMSLVVVELTIVMAATGTVAIASLGMHVSFNYD